MVQNRKSFKLMTLAPFSSFNQKKDFRGQRRKHLRVRLFFYTFFREKIDRSLLPSMSKYRITGTKQILTHHDLMTLNVLMTCSPAVESMLSSCLITELFCPSSSYCDIRFVDLSYSFISKQLSTAENLCGH